MPNLSVSLPTPLYLRVIEAAAEEERSQSEVIRRAVIAYFAPSEAEKDDPHA